MAWNTLLTWADGDVPTAPQFNQQFRDNFNELAQHNHAGGSGSGAATLGGAAGLEYMSFHEGPPPGTPGGTLNAFYATNGTFGWVNANGTAFLAANSTHEHTGSWVQPVEGTATGSIDITSLRREIWTDGPLATSTNTFVRAGSATFTVGGSGSRALFLGAFFYISNETAANRGFVLRASYVLNGTGTTTLSGSIIQATATGSAAYHYAIFGTLTGQASGSYEVWAEIQGNTAAGLGDNVRLVYSTIAYSEFQIR